jgi:hypothetical protein
MSSSEAGVLGDAGVVVGARSDEIASAPSVDGTPSKQGGLGAKASIGSAVVAGILAWSVLHHPKGPWLVEYFPNRNLEGTPEKLERAVVDFADLQRAGFPAGVPDREAFSLRMRACLVIGTTGTYFIRATADDALRLYLDNKLEIDAWQRPAPGGTEKPLNLTAGVHPVTVEYANFSGPGSLRLEMSDPAFRVTRPLHDRTVPLGANGQCDSD